MSSSYAHIQNSFNPAVFYGGAAVVAGEGFCCGDNNLKTKSIADDSPNYEKLQYYYHSDHRGSASYITNLDGEVVQHIEYVPFGEVFLEERNNTWNTPFLFNGKELDEETGLYYYGARYYNPRISLWYGVDPLAEKYPAHSPYAFVGGNPIGNQEVDGRWWFSKSKSNNRVSLGNGTVQLRGASEYAFKMSNVNAVYEKQTSFASYVPYIGSVLNASAIVQKK